MSQIVLVLRNASMSELATKGSARDPGPSHTCEETADGRVCTMIGECAWLQAWRAARAFERELLEDAA